MCIRDRIKTKAGENYERLIRVLVRGPAKVNSNLFPAKDPEGVDYDTAKVQAAFDDEERLWGVFYENINLGGASVEQLAPFAP